MTWPLIWFITVMTGILMYALLAPRIVRKKVQTQPVPTGMGEGGTMDWIARKVVLGLGRLTIAALHLFEKLGVNMANVDEVLASWTAWSQDVKTKLADALADAQNLRDTDAAEDAEQANVLSEALAAKVQAAYDAATSSPAEEDPSTEPEAPVDPVDPVPPVDPGPTDPPAPFDPTPAPAEDEPVVDEPVAEDPEAGR